ncbi:MAG TPA: xanthine dehydrogenase family protein subunit M [Candidatus Limnocylindrales bacterium]|nr:xanthine dehydrogenase family protein subunit M [Candidatus Limnocylindrales bacterium]
MPVEPPVVSPASLTDAFAILREQPHRPVAGGTDLLVQLTGEIGPAPDRVIDLWRLDELRGVGVHGDAIELGALTTYTDIRRSPICREHLPALVEAAATIGATQIQNRGTIGGNVMNASPAGDTLPVLLALDAVLVVGGADGEREVAAAEFWPAYRRTAARPDELLLRVRVPLGAGREQRFRKVGTRRAQAISKVVVAAAWRGTDTWQDVRLALGSVAATPVRVREAEAALEGRPRTLGSVEAAVDALGAAINPIDDVRSTAAYRREAARRVVRRLLAESLEHA